MIRTEMLSKIYRANEVETIALNKVSLEIKEQEFVTVMGPSGCGKSTLLNLIGLLDNPNSGHYFFNDKDVSRFNEKNRAEIRKKNIGFVFQSFNLIDELTVFENVELPLIYLGIKSNDRKEIVNSMLEKMHIINKKRHFPQQLSGGQQQRVAVSRAIITEPNLILADEPTGNLDSVHGKEVMELLAKLNEEGTTILMVTHSEHDAAYAHRRLNLFDGQIISEN